MKKNYLFVLLVTTIILHTISSNAQTGITKYGHSALINNIGGDYNSAFGYYSLFTNGWGSFNTASGYAALHLNTSGNNNMAIGYKSLYSNNGNNNTAIGSLSLYSNKNGERNTATGMYSLYYNLSSYNTASGYASLYVNTTGERNTANGYKSLFSNKEGAYNTASGFEALYSNQSGSYNKADGYSALYFNTSGSYNTGIGVNALYHNTTGSYNTALGYFASVNSGALTNATAIGYNARVDASNKVRIGNTAVTSIGGQVGWTTFSDGRYKKDVKEDIQGLAFINSLRPISYTVNVKGLNEYHNKGKKQVTDNEVSDNIDGAGNAEMKKGEDVAGKMMHNGFIAQEVEEAAKKLNFEFGGVDKPESKDGLYGLRYENFIVPLVKAVQELSKMKDDKDAKIDDLIKRIEKLETMKNVEPKTSKIISLNDALLEQNIPNPFNKTTTIRYSLPQKFTKAQIVIVDKSGKILKEINISGSGKGAVNIDAAALSSGSFNYSLVVDERIITSKQMVLAK